MKRIVVTFIVFMMLFSTAYAETVEKEDNKSEEEVVKINKIEDSTVSIFSVNPGISFCSGVLIGEDDNNSYVVTCKHCVSEEEEVYVEDNRVIDIRANVDDDLALFVVEGKIADKEVAKLANSNVKRYDKLSHVGYPALKIYKSDGEVLRVTNDWIWADFTSQRGCSGGGVYNGDKELVGILWGKLIGMGITIFEPIEDVKRFLSTVLVTP